MPILLETRPNTQASVLPIEEDLAPLVSPLPEQSWIKGRCPACSAPLVDNEYHLGGRGFYTLRQCWNALQEPSGCDVWDYVAAFGDGSENR